MGTLVPGRTNEVRWRRRQIMPSSSTGKVNLIIWLLGIDFSHSDSDPGYDDSIIKDQEVQDIIHTDKLPVPVYC